jgi:hypothetical protein
MKTHNEIIIEASAERVWSAVGDRFMEMGEWAAPVTSSCPIGTREPGVGAVRLCSHAAVGPIKGGVVKERLTRFEPAEMLLEYEAVEGLPGFIARASNVWRVERVDDQRCHVSVRSTVTLRALGKVFACPIQWQLEVVGARVTEELKFFVEQGRPHPRELAAARSLPHEPRFRSARAL